jgi:hypothetical protein
MGQAEAESWQTELEEQAENVLEHAASASDVAAGVFWSTDTSGDRIKRGLNCNRCHISPRLHITTHKNLGKFRPLSIQAQVVGLTGSILHGTGSKPSPVQSSRVRYLALVRQRNAIKKKKKARSERDP